MNLRKRYILYLRETGEIIITSDGPAIAELLGVSKHTVSSWFRNKRTVLDRYDKGYILVRGGRFIKSTRGKDNFGKKHKYNW